MNNHNAAGHAIKKQRAIIEEKLTNAYTEFANLKNQALDLQMVIESLERVLSDLNYSLETLGEQNEDSTDNL